METMETENRLLTPDIPSNIRLTKFTHIKTVINYKYHQQKNLTSITDNHKTTFQHEERLTLLVKCHLT